MRDHCVESIPAAACMAKTRHERGDAPSPSHPLVGKVAPFHVGRIACRREWFLRSASGMDHDRGPDHLACLGIFLAAMASERRPSKPALRVAFHRWSALLMRLEAPEVGDERTIV